MANCDHINPNYSRRDFLTKTSLGLGAVALGSLINPLGLLGSEGDEIILPGKGILGSPHFAPRAKRVIYLFQSGGPSQLETFDHKPELQKRNGEELPESIRKGQRLTGMTAGQKSFPLAGSQFSFAQYGESGAMVSELFPYTSKIVDDLCFIKSMYTEAINHDPAITFIQTGSQQPGRPSMGSWLNYGLGSDNENLPAFTVLVTKNKYGQPLYGRLWGNGFLPSKYQGIQFRAAKDPVLYLSNPDGVTNEDRRRHIDYLKKLQEIQYNEVVDPEIQAKNRSIRNGLPHADFGARSY